MSNYLTIKDIATQWGVTTTWVSILCNQGRINGALKQGHRWLVPADAERPKDLRKSTKTEDDAKFRFIDLFAGIGGFHQAMRYLGGKCVMAAEINQACQETYKLNFTTEEGDIRGDVNLIDPQEIAPFDVLCAGFPCQPFSKAGQQKGFQDEKRGNLFYTILRILDAHPETKFVVLENVRNLADKTENWDIIRTELLKRDFVITKDALILSPSDFGLPQVRERVYILGIKRDFCNNAIKEKGYFDITDLDIGRYYKTCKMGDALSILVDDADDSYQISDEQALMIQAWDEFRVNTGMKVIGFPIWINCFGIGIDDDQTLREAVGYNKMPEWKQRFVDKNREYYLKHKEYINAWVERYDMLNRIKLYQKFEWNCGEDVSDIHDAIIQIRQSGIRCKRNTYFPSLVAIVNTPIIWDKTKQVYRHITPREAANLQNFDKRYKFAGTDAQIYKQLGNSVNVRVLKILCKKLFALRQIDPEEQKEMLI